MWKLVTVLFMLQITTSTAHAGEEGDVCGIRPDLCDDSIPEPRHPVRRQPDLSQRKPNAVVRTNLNRPTVNRQQGRSVDPQGHPARTIPAAKTAASTYPVALRNQKAHACREANKPYNLNDADLPICGARTATASDAPAEEASDSSARSPASVGSNSKVDFNSYLNANSGHRAMARHEAQAQAFQENVRQATLNPPTIDMGVGVREHDIASSTSTTVPTTGGLQPPSSPGAAGSGNR